MATRKRRSKRKKAKSKQKRERKRTELEVLKEKQSALYSRVQANVQIILNQTDVEREELGRIINQYGYDAIPTLDGFDISEPIWNQMVKIFKLYDKISILVERLQHAQDKLLIHEIEQKTTQIESQVAEIDEENKFYTQKPDEKGIIKMKQKYYVEKEHWELKKAEAEEALKQNPKNTQALSQLEQAKRELSTLKKKRWWARGRNIMPTVSNIMFKVSKGINQTTKGLGEMGDQLSTMGGGYSKTGNKESKNDYGFSPENIFGSTSKKKKQDDWF